MFKYQLTALIITFLSFSSLNAQDLIERTRLNLQPQKTEKVNEVAKFVARNWNRTNTRNAPYSVFEFGDQTIHSRLNAPVEEAVYLNLKKKELSDLLKARPSQLSLRIPVDEVSSIQLDLIAVENVSDDFRVTMSDGAAPPADNAIFYRGIIAGNTNSWAAISIFEEDIRGVIADENGNYSLGKLKNLEEFTLYNDLKFTEELPFTCQYDDNSFSRQEEIIETENNTPNRMAVTCVKIYIEIDFHSYGQLGGTNAAAKNYVDAVFHEVKTVYLNESLNIEMSGLKIWNTQDSYGYAGFNCGTVLNNFEAEQGSNFNGDLAHLITVTGQFGNICGLASTNCPCGSTASVCNAPVFCTTQGNAHGYSQTFTSYESYPTPSQTVILMSHELGHNFGSPHTQSCAWNGNNTALDACVAVEQQVLYAPFCRSSSLTNCGTPSPAIPANGRTIMSYCSNILLTNGFGTQPGNLIRANVANGTCLTNCMTTASCLGDGVCRSSMTIIATDISCTGSIGTFKSASTLSTNGTVAIPSGQSVNFHAGTSVTLRPGFSAGAGFTASIQNCIPNLQSKEDQISAYLASLTTTEKVAIEPEMAMSTAFKIAPNPFAHSTKISFNLETPSIISLQVYDLNGHLVDNVLIEESLAKGYQEVDYHTIDLSVGMYYLVMRSEEGIAVQKMSIMTDF